MVIYRDQMVQRELNYAIVDEVDSILIDEARTPLIISGVGEKSTQLYYVADTFVRGLKNEADFTIDEKAHTVVLTEEGVATVSYTHLRAHETVLDLVCRLLLEKKNHQHANSDKHKRK